MLECWCLVKKEITWTYTFEEAAVARFVFEVVDDGRNVVIFCVGVNVRRNVAEVLKLDLRTRTSNVLRRKEGYPKFQNHLPHYCQVLGDFAVAADYFKVVVLQISTGCISSYLWSHTILAIHLTPRHLAVVHYELCNSKLQVILHSWESVVSAFRNRETKPVSQFITVANMQFSANAKSLPPNLSCFTCSLHPSPFDNHVTRIWMTFHMYPWRGVCRYPLICVCRLETNLETNQSIQVFPSAYIPASNKHEHCSKILFNGSEPYVSYSGNLLKQGGASSYISLRTLEDVKDLSGCPSLPRINSHISQGSRALTYITPENIIVEYSQIHVSGTAGLDSEFFV